MKKSQLLFLLLLLLAISSSHAQLNYPFPNKDGEWFMYGLSGDGPAIYSKNPYTVKGDTIINDLQYFILADKYFSCALRTESSKVYGIDPLNVEKGEQLMYDFNLKLNDTISLVHFWTDERYKVQLNWKVTKISKISLNNTERKVIELYNPKFEGYKKMKWIEGIGCNEGPIYLLYGTSSSLQAIDLYCYRENKNPVYGNCNLTGLSEMAIDEPTCQLETTLKMIRIIHVEQKEWNLKIYNTLGILVLNINGFSNGQVDLEQLKHGVYVWRLESEIHCKTQSFMIQ